MTERELVERLGLYAEELIEPHDGDIGGARVRAAKAMREAATLLERLSSSEVTEEWLPIESAPKDGLIDVWVALQGGYRLAGAYYDSICGEWRTSRPAGQLVCIRERNVTHWRPLPEPPQTKDGPNHD